MEGITTRMSKRGQAGMNKPGKKDPMMMPREIRESLNNPASHHRSLKVLKRFIGERAITSLQAPHERSHTIRDHTRSLLHSQFNP